MGHYVVRYDYSVADESFDGSFNVDAPLESGHQFAILYTPVKPWENSCGPNSERGGFRGKVIAGVAAGLIIALILWMRAKLFS